MTEPDRKNHKVVDLAELAAEREKVQKRMRWYHLFFPVHGDDVQAYRRLLKYVLPYKWYIVGSMLLAMLAGALMASQVWILEDGIRSILHISQAEKHYVPELDQWLDTLGAAIPGNVLVVYDACEAGSFVGAGFVPPIDPTGGPLGSVVTWAADIWFQTATQLALWLHSPSVSQVHS